MIEVADHGSADDYRAAYNTARLVAEDDYAAKYTIELGPWRRALLQPARP